jgi:AraC family transcriptional regulator, melibiose operon regulatory protein
VCDAALLMVKSVANKAIPTTPERRFYSRTRAFGRFGMRIFKPALMDRPHWHGHVEGNLIRNARMIYIVDGQRIVVAPEQLLLFWAGIPHQLVAVEQLASPEPELCNIYVPLDAFLLMSHIPDLQVALLTGGMVQLPRELCTSDLLRRWYADYRSNEPERLDVVKMELNALFRRVSLDPLPFLKNPWRDAPTKAGLPTPHVRHVVDMVRHVLENLHEPLKNEDVTKVTGLHPNYALSLFSRTMLLPLKQFIIRMRLLRARGMLLESDTAIATIAVESGFGSASQFYAHFSAAYGLSPMQLRQSIEEKREILVVAR